MSDPRDALDAIGQLPDAEIDLADAALQFARVDAPDADWHDARAHLSDLARDAVALAGELGGADLSTRAGALAGLFSGRHRYRGDAETYDDPANANLIHVIERRRGLPVALGILWLHAAEAAGWTARGLDFPGHFLVAVEGDRGQAVVDVFSGGVGLQAPELRGLLKRFEGEKAELRPGVLRRMERREVLLRLQNNLKLRRLRGGDMDGALRCAEDMLRVAPDHVALWREAGLMNQRLDRIGAALACLDRAIELDPMGETASRLRAVVEELRHRLN